MQPKVTVIIAVYNAEKYIEKCVRTLFGQTLDALEYIFVDDCSPDRSIEIMQRVLEEYPERKNQVKVIYHEVNKGVGQSRQDGIDAATGEYIIHCDPDDWVDVNMYKKMYNHAMQVNAGIVLCDLSYESRNKTDIYSQRPLELSAESLLGSIAGSESLGIHCSLCNKLIKSSIHPQIRIPEGMDTYEDAFVLIQILGLNPIIGYIPLGMYHYRIDTGLSLSKRLSNKELSSDRLVVDNVFKLSSINDNVKKAFAVQVLSRALDSNCYSDKEFKKYYSSYKFYLKFNQQIKGKIRKFFMYLSCVGYHSLYKGIRQLKRYILS